MARPIRLLIVDDERRFVETLSKRLTARGLYVEGVCSGAEALALVQAKPFDVALLDVRMPGMDGLATLKEIRKFQPLLQVIMLSGTASISAAVEGMRLGALEYLLKPASLEEVLPKIEAASKRKTLQEQQEAAARGGGAGGLT
jgi:DNA-binding NtrC family response regulator